jgi:IclR family transcriptional regulator, acetate operon repressor
VEHFERMERRGRKVSATQSGTQAVDRAAQLLVRVIEARKPLSFGSLTESAELPKSTASRLLNALERHGLVERDRDGAFRPGPVVTRFARLSSSTDNLIETSAPFLETLSRRTGETVNLAVPGQNVVEQVAQVDSRYMLGATNWVGLAVPFHCSALGKIFLAHGIVDLPKGRLEQRGPRTLTTREALAADLALVLRRGYAVADEELEPGLVAIAAPVRDATGTVVASISVSGPSVRLTPDRTVTIAAMVAGEAHALSTALGFQGAGADKEGAA